MCPYIPQDNRKKFEEALEYIANFINFNDIGELNYFFTKVIDIHIKKVGERYKNYNDILGVLECVKLELYRKKIAKYEDKKESENGKVWE